MNDINTNNDITTGVFNSICNFSDIAPEYIKIPIDTIGRVKGNTGEFVNIKFDKIHTNTADHIFIDSGVKVDHNLAVNRFSDNINDSSINDNYAHDTGMIIHVDASNNFTTLYNLLSQINYKISNNESSTNALSLQLNDLKNAVDDLYEQLNINKEYKMSNVATYSLLNRSITQNDEFVMSYNNEPNSYTYPAKVYNNQLFDVINNEYDKIDIINNKKFRYYIVDNQYTKINNQYPCSLNCDVVGTQTSLICDINSNKDLIIKLNYDGKNYNCIKINHDDIDMCRIVLTCVDINEYGVKWYLTNYSGNIEMIKL